MFLPFSNESMLDTPSTVTGNFTHVIKPKSPLDSSFQQNFGNNVQFRSYLEEKRDNCQTKASKRNELEISVQRLEASSSKAV